MASIRRRKPIDGGSWEVQIRRKGIPQLTLSFATYEEAAEWVEKNEYEYIKKHRDYRRHYQSSEVRVEMRYEREIKKGVCYKGGGKGEPTGRSRRITEG